MLGDGSDDRDSHQCRTCGGNNADDLHCSEDALLLGRDYNASLPQYTSLATVIQFLNEEDQLSQEEADSQISMTKKFVSHPPIQISLGASKKFAVTATDGTRTFRLTVTFGRKRIEKYTIQLLSSDEVSLVRLDIGAGSHKNRHDNSRVGGDHFHVYREGFEDRIAVPVDRKVFTNIRDFTLTFHEFCQFCRITKRPRPKILR